MADNKVRTRFAPSPTGFMHVGNLRTALFEEITEEGLLTGYTENYVRVYAEPEGDPEKLLNEFCTVIMGTPFEDGMTAEIV